MSSVFDALQLQRIAQAIEDGQAGATATATVNLDFSNVGDMTGATAGTAGTHGLVPAPAAGDQDKTLHGDGSWRVDSADLPQVFGSSSGSVITLTDAADYVASDLVINIEPVQSGSGDPSPDNIRPISGWTETTITRCGVNLFNINKVQPSFIVDDRTIRVTGGAYNRDIYTGRSGNTQIIYPSDIIKMPMLSNGNYVFKYGSPENANLSLLRINNDRTTSSIAVGVNGNFTMPTSHRITIRRPANATRTFNDIMIIKADEAPLEYIPYTGQDYTITFPAGAGTVYGGTLDVTNGTLTVTKANIASYAGETLPGAWISDRDVYDPDNPTTPPTGAQVVYDLDTPLTYQIISTDVYLTSGTCNVWADTGDIITLKYVKADYNDLMQAVPKMKMPDYSAVIASGTYNQPGTVYTATQDCFIYLEYSYIGTPCYIDVDGATVARLWTSSGQSQAGSLIPLKAGNVVTSHGGSDTLPYAVYPMI